MIENKGKFIMGWVLLLSSCVGTQLDRECRALFPEGEPGAAVLVLQGDKVLYERYFGLADLPSRTPVVADTRFNIASVSKQFTAVAVLQLVADGKLSLEDPVGRYFPEYTDPLWQEVQIRHLLSHSSGIPDERGYLSREAKVNGDEALALEYLQTLDHLHFAPGSAYEYINPTFVLLGRLVERISGQAFTDYMQEHVFDPAGMGQTAYIGLEEGQQAAHAYEYERETGDGEESAGSRTDAPEWYEYDYGEETFFGTRPDGGIYTTVRDFVKWEKALRDCLDDKPGALLPARLLREAFTPQTLVSGSPWSDYQNRPGTWYGYGWFIEPEKHCIYHTGDNGGFKILAARYPDRDALVLVFAARADWDRYALKTRLEELTK